MSRQSRLFVFRFNLTPGTLSLLTSCLQCISVLCLTLYSFFSINTRSLLKNSIFFFILLFCIFLYLLPRSFEQCGAILLDLRVGTLLEEEEECRQTSRRQCVRRSESAFWRDIISRQAVSRPKLGMHQVHNSTLLSLCPYRVQNHAIKI